MERWLIIGLLCLLGCLSRLPAQALSGEFSADLGATAYDCTLELQPQANIASNSTVNLLLDWESARNGTQLSLSTRKLTVQAIVNGKASPSTAVASGIAAGKTCTLVVMRRGEWLTVTCDDALLYRGQVPRPAGTKGVLTPGPGWSVTDVRVQRIEPVRFADNFMRSRDESGEWISRSGTWKLQSAWDDDPRGNGGRFAYVAFAQNPFAWVGVGGSKPALCTVGKPHWEDYTMTVAVLPPANGAVGVAVNLTDANNGLLVRWSPADDRGRDGGQLVLYRLVDGERKPLARHAGGYLPGHWYRLSVVSAPNGVRVLVDGDERLAVTDATPWRGGAGLYVEGGAPGIFDDVTIYGRALNTDLMEESQQARLSRRLTDDPQMQRWARDWMPFPGQPNTYLSTTEVPGDQRMTLSFVTGQAAQGQIWMVLNGDGANPVSGYRAMLRHEADGKMTYAIFRDDTTLATRQGDALTNGEEYTVRFWHVGDKLSLELDGERMVSVTDRGAETGQLAAYRADGCFANVHNAMTIGRNVLDYLFIDAPVDWTSEGTWMSTVRWACDARWSFLSGWSHGDAVLWHKKTFTGDHALEAYVGVKMEYPRAREGYEHRYRDLAVTICGDGRNPRSGYTGIYGAPDTAGVPNRRTVLMRNGVVVAEVPGLVLPQKDAGHRLWFRLALRKRGAAVEFAVGERTVLTYTDPQPLNGGVPAVWTTNNGLSIARARLTYATPPRPRTDTAVAIDEPDYPEWLNLGTPLRLSFPHAAAVSGKPVTLRALPRGGPQGDEALAIDTDSITFTPRKTGTYWYQLFATEGEARSPSTHLLLPVFDPALGRDDSHALALYRFDDGDGKTITDRSKIEPALNLNIGTPATAHWLPGQGLSITGAAQVRSVAGAAKLMAIATSRECTLECWISPDTLYPVTGWEGCIASWESNSNMQRNFALMHHSFSAIMYGMPRVNLNPPPTCSVPFTMHIGLMHLVVTWSGGTTTFYLNGDKVGERAYEWNTANWTPDAPLYLGNQSDIPRTFLGTYYLFAIHDRAFTPEQVMRHYQAGPSAR